MRATSAQTVLRGNGPCSVPHRTDSASTSNSPRPLSESVAGASGLGGSHRILKLKDGRTVGHNEVQLISGLITNPREVQILEMRYNLIRAQTLTPRLSREFIEKLLGDT